MCVCLLNDYVAANGHHRHTAANQHTHTQLVFETIEPHCNWGAVFVMLVKARHDDNAPHN